ncbi:vacuolar protein sorting-associated protein 13D-like protein [Leptotrombidium deliense]|uniref:Vacuolar protein sorting-associated protein 13D-like protein n=1 Tax=Leptotrombidium deliense TaxID=299467 RepID=A0A443SKX5_9ACAR|nr:vacuolar protein sorting-associated protein 13D-like protein [Leptotrombidium deliense]
MLERLVAWVLNAYIGEYFGNVNTDQLSIALHQGEVELEGLPLKVESLRHWGLPVDVKAGYIGKIRVKVPVYRIRSEPWSISIEELYIVAHSLTDFTYNEDVEKQSLQDYKLSLLDALEMRWKSQYESNEEQSYYASSYTSWLSFGASVVSNIVDGIQLTIKSVHIRYEDSCSVKGSHIACGLVIRDLYAQSADKCKITKNDTESFFNTNDTNSNECVRKSVNLSGFDIYWDTCATLIGELQLPDIVDWMRILSDTCVNEFGGSSHNYILSSVCAKAQLMRNRSERPLRSTLKPRLRFDLVLERFPITLNLTQYKQMMKWSGEFRRTSTLWKYRKWRPITPLKECRSLWWQYAANAHLQQWRMRTKCRNWSYLIKRVKDILDYKRVYYEYLMKPETFTKDLKMIKDRIETEFDYDEICIIREIVYSLVKKHNKKIETEAPATNGWINWMTGWYSQPQTMLENEGDSPVKKLDSPTEIRPQPSTQLVKRDVIEERFLFDNIENETFLRRDTVFSRVNLSVQHASFTLISDISQSADNFNSVSEKSSDERLEFKPILDLELIDMKFWFEWRPRVDSFTLELKLRALNVNDKMCEKPAIEVSPRQQNTFLEDISSLLYLFPCKGNLSETTLWLTQNGKQALTYTTKEKNHYVARLYTVVSFTVESGVLCLIDYCKNTDVPLLEISFTNLDISQTLTDSRLIGRAKSVITCDYYNRYLSGWEPLLEPWKFDITWQHQFIIGSPSKLSVEFDSDEPINIVITRTFLDLYRNMQRNWIEDYKHLTKSTTPAIRQHSPFVPFALKNDTGCELHFYTVLSSTNESSITARTPSISEVSKLITYITGNSFSSELAIESPIQRMRQQQRHVIKTDNQSGKIVLPQKFKWITVKPNEVVPFCFEDSVASRQRSINVLKAHKIVVKVDGWEEMVPVTVDKVGVYFREAKPATLENESARVVFEVTMEDNARKLISVRSALLLHNGTPNTVEIQLHEHKKKEVMYVVPDATIPVPLPLVRYRIWIRPCEVGVNKCREPLRWEHVRRPGQSKGDLLMCSPLGTTERHASYSTSLPFYISIFVRRLNFPPDSVFQHSTVSRTLPGHLISLLSPLKLLNLLPYELNFSFKNSNVSGTVKAGKYYSLHSLDTTKEFSLTFSLDEFPISKPLTILPGTFREATFSVEFFDRKDRPLILQAEVTSDGNHSHSFIIRISCPYWLINRTNLPLIFKQDGVDHEASGQFQEHEFARCVEPLMFNFVKTDENIACKVRLGKSLGRTSWTNSFYLNNGTRIRRLRAISRDHKQQETIYEIKISIENGRGKYHRSLMVTFSPHSQSDSQLSTTRMTDKQKISVNESKRSSFGCELKLNINVSVLGLSLVNKYNEELVYASLNGIVFEYHFKLIEHFLNCTVKYFQVDNQLRDAEKSVILHCTELDSGDPTARLPMFNVSIHKRILHQVEIEFFERLQIKIRDISLMLEEMLLLKLLQFFGFADRDADSIVTEDEEEGYSHKVLGAPATRSRLYFTRLEIQLHRIRLSVLTSSQLTHEYKAIKKKVGLRLIRFEDVLIHLLPFKKKFCFDSFYNLLKAIIEHYKSQLRSQSAKILGAVDFLGNPLGFYNDVVGGLNEVFTDGNFQGLLTNITHGISDSTVKFSSALSDSLGSLAMDSRHEEIRKRIKQDSSDPIQAGIRGLGVGILGGVMSIITQTYMGVSTEGLTGFFSGFGKGVIGTITKPTVGMLDFATGAANVIRESSRKPSNRTGAIDKVRFPRQCSGISGLLLPTFDTQQSLAQLFFHRFISDKEENEKFISFQMILDDTALIISTEKVHFLSWGNQLHENGDVCLSVAFRSVTKCQTFTEMNLPGSGVYHYFVILSIDNEQSYITSRGQFSYFAEFRGGRLRVRAAKRETAVEVTEQINCAKTIYEERKYTLFS